MIELRDYQRDLLERVQKALEPANASVMMQLPTGGGKTVIAAHLLADYLTGGRKAVWLTHRKELVTQTIERLAGTNGVRAVHERRWAVGIPAPTTAGGVMVLMAQTVGRRVDETGVWSQYDEQDLMVIDEAHHATAKGWALAMKHWPGRIVGMTATPWRLSKKEGFDHLLHHTTGHYSEFQEGVAHPVFLSVDSDIQAMRQLGDEVAQLSALIEETEFEACGIVSAKKELAKEIVGKLERSGLADLLNEPLTEVQFNFKLSKDGMKLDVDNLLLNGELLKDVFFAAYPFRTGNVLDRLKALVEETEAAKSKTVTAESSNEPSRRGSGEVST